jgi:hypothetical protein
LPAASEAREEIVRVLWSKVEKNDSLSEEQKERILALLSEFARCFSDKLLFPGQARTPKLIVWSNIGLVSNIPFLWFQELIKKPLSAGSSVHVLMLVKAQIPNPKYNHNDNE